MRLSAFRINWVFQALTVILLIAVIGMLARDVRGGPLDPPAPPASTDSVKLPGTPISSVPFVITTPGYYYLTRDLAYGGSGDAISFAGFNEFVTLDLNGFTLSGIDQGVGIKALGPSPPAQFPLTIKNGYVRDFTVGLDMDLAAHVRVENVHVFSNTLDGMALGNHTVVDGCTAANNGRDGIVVIGLSRISDCMVVDNPGNGIWIWGQLTVVENSQTLRNGTGIRSDANLVMIKDNDSLNNSFHDINVVGGTVKFNSYCTSNFAGPADSHINFCPD